MARTRKASAVSAMERDVRLDVPMEQRYQYIQVAAYYIAERRGFQGGSDIDDWLQAEVEIDQLVRGGVVPFAT